MSQATAASPLLGHLDAARRCLDLPMFFVVGCQKSGTTWVQKLLDAHPNLRCHGEAYFGPVLLPALQQAIQAYNQRHKAGDLGPFHNADLGALFALAVGLKLHAWIGDDPGIHAVGEKTPEHALCLDTLSQVFPRARVIHIIRDGRDVCVSGWHHNLRQKGEAFTQQFSTFESYVRYTLTNHWVPYVTRARQWGAANPERYCEIRYEELRQDSQAQTAAMLKFLDADDQLAQACVDAAKPGEKPNDKPADAPAAQTSGSFFRKGAVGDWREMFDEASLATTKQVAERLLDDLGYVTEI